MSDDLSIPNPAYRLPRRRGWFDDPVLRRLLIYAGALIAGGLVIGGVATLFNRHPGPVPVVQPDPRPLRVKPENPGGMQIAGLKGDHADETDQPGKLAPSPESPDPAAYQSSPSGSPAASPVTQSNGAAVTPPVPHPAAPATGPAAPASHPAAPPPPTPLPATPATVAPKTATALVTPPNLKPAPAPTPQPASGALPAPPGKTTPAANKPASVQLAALLTEDAARAEWQNMERRMPDLFGGRSPNISKIDRDGRTYWRVRLSGFADVAQAKAFCERVRAKNASCSVADF